MRYLPYYKKLELEITNLKVITSCPDWLKLKMKIYEELGIITQMSKT